MKFIKKKNMQELEELLFAPQLHWMYIIKHMVRSLPFFITLLIIWAVFKRHGGFFCQPEGFGSFLFLNSVFKHIFLAAVIVVLVVFVCRIFLYLSTEYGVTNKRLILKKGVIRLVITEIPFDRIESISCVQGLLGRIFKYGTVYISGVGGTIPVFYMVHRPFTLRRKIAEIIEKNKAITVMHGGMPKTKPPKPEPQVVEEEPVFRYGTFVRVLPDNNS